MALQTIWKVHSVEKVPNTGSPLDVSNPTIAAINSVGFAPQSNVTREVTAGKVFATSGQVDFTSVDLTFTTLMSEAVLNGLIPIRGACIANGDVWNVYAAQYGCDGPLAGANHRRYSISKGMVYITGLSADHQGDLSVDVRIQGVLNGGAPVTVLPGVALPSATQIGDETGRWTISDKTTTNGFTVVNKRSVSVDMGVTTSTEGADSEQYDSFASIDSVLPVVTISGVDPTWFDDIGLTIFGAPVTHANTVVGFRKRLAGGGFEADGNGVHITMSANGPAFYEELLSGTGVGASTASYRIEPIESSSGQDPLLFSTGVSI